MCSDKRLKISKLINEYEKLSDQLEVLKAREKDIKKEFESYLDEKEILNEKISTETENVYNIVKVSQSRESLIKDKVKEYLSEEQFNNCIKKSSSSFIKITKLKEKLPKGIL